MMEQMHRTMPLLKLYIFITPKWKLIYVIRLVSSWMHFLEHDNIRCSLHSINTCFPIGKTIGCNQAELADSGMGSVKQVLPGALVHRQGRRERLMECDTVHYLAVFTLSPLISFDNFPRQAMRRVLLRHTLILCWQWLTVFLPVGTGMEKTIVSSACLTHIISEFF